MRIPQFIYTKLPPGESPWSKTGFHTVLYSTEVLQHADLLTLESLIHYPGAKVLDQKWVVGWHELDAGLYMVLISVSTLTEVRDEFGREGMFIAHGFLIPQEGWAMFTNPAAAQKVISEFRILNLEQLHKHPGADLTKGSIAPLSLDASLFHSAQAQEKVTANENLLGALLALTEEKFNDSILLKGSVQQASDSMNACYALLPDPLKIKLAWDPAFDSGKSFFFPIKVQGFSQNQPVTGDPLLFDLTTQLFLPDQRLTSYTTLSNPYAQYVLTGSTTVETRNAAYRISQVILRERKAEATNGDLQAVGARFVQVAEKIIREQASQMLSEFVDITWANWMAKSVMATDLVQLMIEGFPKEHMSELLASAILQNPAEETPTQDIPKALIAHSPILEAIYQCKKGKAPTTDVITDQETLRKLFLWALSANVLKSSAINEWATRLPQNVISSLLLEARFKEQAEKWVTNKLRGDSKLNEEVARALAYGSLSNGVFLGTMPTPEDAGTFIWNAIKNGHVEVPHMKGIVTWLQKNPALATNPNLEPLVSPPNTVAELPDAWQQVQKMRGLYVWVLVDVYKNTKPQLLKMGWHPSEIETAMRAKPEPLLKRLFS